MKNKIPISIILFVVLSLCLQACKEKSQDSKTSEESPVPELQLDSSSVSKALVESALPSKFKNPLRPNENLELGKIYSDTVNYVDFNAFDFDDRIFSVEKNEDITYLIYNKDLKTKPAAGDKLEINWKIDSIRPAGDPEFLDFKAHLVTYDILSSFTLKDKEVKALWRDIQYDTVLEVDIDTMILDETYFNTISAPEKAALAYVATFIGNECEWDGKVNDSRSNLKCKILSNLDLGYQCSDTHLGFLQNWFSKDATVLKKLEKCRTIPNTATVQSTFDEISIVTNSQDQSIAISYRVKIINTREGKVSTYIQTDTFQYSSGSLTLIDSEKIDNQSLENTTEEAKNSFSISCGSGCTMTYTEHEIISNVDTNQIKFKVALYINEVQDDEYFETYVFDCDSATKDMQIQLKGRDDNRDDLHPDLQNHLKTYSNRFCQNQ